MSDDRNQVRDNSRRICKLEEQMEVLLSNFRAMYQELDNIEEELNG